MTTYAEWPWPNVLLHKAVSFCKCLPAFGSPCHPNVLPFGHQASEGRTFKLACWRKCSSPLQANYAWWGGRKSDLSGLGKKSFFKFPRELLLPAVSQAEPVRPVLNLSYVLAAARIVLFIITFIWSNCFLMPSTSSMQIMCIPDFLSSIKATMILLCKQSLSTSDHFNNSPWN